MHADCSQFRLVAALFTGGAILISAINPASSEEPGKGGEGGAGDTPGGEVERIVIDFADGGIGSDIPWRAVNDGVMGGLSEGGSRRTADGTLEFSGVLSLENNGGFSSVRTGNDEQASHDFRLGGFDGVVLKVRGDGRTYDVRLNSDARTSWGGDVSFKGRFETRQDEWIEVKVPFSSFVPTFHGELLDGVPLDPAKVRRIGLLIGDKKEGPFRLEVAWIKAYRDAASD